MRKLLLVVAAIGLLPSAATAREGFGFTKKAVSMNRTEPPALDIGARRVRVTATSDRSGEKDEAATLRRYTEELVLSGAGTIAPEKDKGDVRISIAVDRLDSNESWETERKSRYEKTGTKREWNEKKKKYEEKDVYSTVYYDQQNKVTTASLTGAWDIADRSGKVVDSGSINETFRQTYDEGKGSPALPTLEDTLLKRAAKSVAGRIVPTQGAVSVLVPKGSFEDLIPLAEMNAWDRYLAGVEAVPPPRDRRQDAYRQYALGVAKEGLAHATAIEDPAAAADLLREAMGHYETAVKSNPRESLFAKGYSSLLSTGNISAPLSRTSTTLAAFEKWTGKAPAARRAERPAAADAAQNRVTNQTLIEMAKAGLADENLIMAIDAASAVDFDTSPNALIALAKGGVSKSVIAHMQKKKK